MVLNINIDRYIGLYRSDLNINVYVRDRESKLGMEANLQRIPVKLSIWDKEILRPVADANADARGP